MGDGDRAGKGTCKCNPGYDGVDVCLALSSSCSGKQCDQCQSDHFKEARDDGKLYCHRCDTACETCTGFGNDQCSQVSNVDAGVELIVAVQ